MRKIRTALFSFSAPSTALYFPLYFPLGEIQEAIFEEKIFRIFFTQKKVFFLASQYKTGLYLDLLLENRI